MARVTPTERRQVRAWLYIGEHKLGSTDALVLLAIAKLEDDHLVRVTIGAISKATNLTDAPVRKSVIVLLRRGIIGQRIDQPRAQTIGRRPRIFTVVNVK